mgnify:CR=1 FL=1
MPIDEIQQLEAIVRGESGAFASWLAGAEPRIRRSLARFARAVDTEAVLQESLLRVWQVAPRFKPDGQPEALLRMGVRIARNLAISGARRRRAQQLDLDLLGEGAEAMPPMDEPDPRLRGTIEQCREKLPRNPQRSLAARLERPGIRDDVLAQSLGMNLNTFFQNIRRARLGLLDCLKRHGIELEIRA